MTHIFFAKGVVVEDGLVCHIFKFRFGFGGEGEKKVDYYKCLHKYVPSECKVANLRQVSRLSQILLCAHCYTSSSKRSLLVRYLGLKLLDISSVEPPRFLFVPRFASSEALVAPRTSKSLCTSLNL